MNPEQERQAQAQRVEDRIQELDKDLRFLSCRYPRSKTLSLSRLNNRLPVREAHPEVMQGTAEFHHQITNALLPQADPVFHQTTALDTAIDMLDPEPTLVQGLVRQLLLPRQLRAPRFLRRHEDLDLREREREEAQILQ